jgi:hypothetical protein
MIDVDGTSLLVTVVAKKEAAGGDFSRSPSTIKKSLTPLVKFQVVFLSVKGVLLNKKH